MATDTLGELVPHGGGDPIPLLQDVLTIGRRDSCDICLKFQNLSGLHCQLALVGGVWQVTDLGSTNGVKVNGSERIPPNAPRHLRPGDDFSMGGLKYTIEYTTDANLDALQAVEEDLFSQSLMEKAGLEKPKRRPGA